jgi:hypothetical protein
MLLKNLCLFLTLVGAVSNGFAAPHLDSPPTKIIDEEEELEASEFKLNNFSITQPEKKSKFENYVRSFSKSDYYHSYHQSIYVFAGLILPFVDSTDDEDLLNYSLGVSYDFKSRNSPKWEAEAIWTTLSVGQLSAMRKHIYNEKASFRPFYRYGVTYKVVPEEKMASAGNFENFLFRVGVGFEDIQKPPKSLRFGIDAAIGVEDIWVMANLGYAWGW